MSIQSEILPLRTLGKACHEGALERCCSVVCGLRPDIVEVAEQPPGSLGVAEHRLSTRSMGATSQAGRRRRICRLLDVEGSAYRALNALMVLTGLNGLLLSPSHLDPPPSHRAEELWRRIGRALPVRLPQAL
jgi:hypothetical protein